MSTHLSLQTTPAAHSLSHVRLVSRALAAVNLSELKGGDIWKRELYNHFREREGAINWKEQVNKNSDTFNKGSDKPEGIVRHLSLLFNASINDVATGKQQGSVSGNSKRHNMQWHLVDGVLPGRGRLQNMAKIRESK